MSKAESRHLGDGAAAATARTTTERLAFSIQLKRLVIDAPTKLPLHHSIYVKWQRGKFFRGKLPPVPCPAQAHPRLHRANGHPQVEVLLPDGHQIQFEVNVHSRAFDDSNGAAPRPHPKASALADRSAAVSMEKKTLDLEIYYLRYEDHTRVELKSRSLIARVSVDLRDWLKDARVGRTSTFLCPFDDNMSVMDGIYVATPVQSSSQRTKTISSEANPPHVSSTRSDASEGDMGDGSSLRLEDIDFPFAPLGVSATVVQDGPRASTTARGGGVRGRGAAAAKLTTPAAESTVLMDAASVLASFGGSQREARSVVEHIMDEGLFRAVTINNPSLLGGCHSQSVGGSASMVVATVYDRMFSDKHGRLGASFHASRGDQSYDAKTPFTYVYAPQQPSGGIAHAAHHNHQHTGRSVPPPPQSSTAGALTSSSSSARYAIGGFKTSSFRLRIAKDKFVDAVENTAVCYIRGDIVVHISVCAPTAPIVGDNLRLESLIHITSNVNSSEDDPSDETVLTPGGTNSTHIAPACTVAMYTHVVVNSSKIKFMFGSKIQQHAEKISILLESVTKQLTAANKGSGALRPLRGSARFRNSLHLSSSAASLDPNLWRRLGDEHTLPHAELVIPTLKRLLPVVSQARQTSALHIQTLENVLGYHRQDATVAATVLQLLLQIVKASGSVTGVAHGSNTLATTIRSIQALHPPGTFDFAELALRQLEACCVALKEQRQREAAGVARNLWVSLQNYMGDADVVQYILDRIQASALGTGARGLSAVWTDGDTSPADKFRRLAAVLSLHMQSLRVCESICHLMNAARDTDGILMDQSIVTALRTAYRLHDPVLGDRCPNLLARIEAMQAAMTPFQKVFGAVVQEEPVFECMVMVEAPTWRTGKLYVTKTFLCVIDEVVPLANMRRIEQYRSVLRPAVRIFMIATVPDYELVLFSRARFLEALEEVGCGWMIRSD